jgi:hypothetical protein
MENTKNIISFDVGMKNLAFCIFQVCETTCKVKIIKWDVINLCTPIVKKCNTLGCTQDAKYCKTFSTMNEDNDDDTEEDEQDTSTNVEKGEKGEKGEKDEINENQEDEYETEYFCNKHAKTSKYKVPTTELNIKKIRKMKLVDIKELIAKYNFSAPHVEHLASLSIVLDEKGEKGEKHENKIVNTNSTKTNSKTKTNSNTKDELINMIKLELHKNYLQHIENVKAMDVDLVTIGKNMMQELDKVLEMGGLGDSTSKIDIAIIENQISTIASRMKTLQGMIAQYFIMKHTPHIEFISASNKLKMFMTKKKTTYTERKAESVEITAELLETKEEFVDFKGYLNKNKKKDDLADCFLQGIYYLTIKNMIKLV